MKKLISALLSASFILGGAVTSFAATGTDKELEKAIKTVKSRISISDDYTDFNFYKFTNYGQTVYQLQWNSSEASLYVNIQGDVITDYSKYINSDSSEGNSAHLAALSKTKLKTAAENAVKKLNPTIYQNIVVDESSYSSYVSGTSAYFSVYRQKAGINVSGDTGSVTVDKDTGELTRFYMNWTPDAGFKSPETAISQKSAQESYAKNIGLMPVYSIISEYSGNTRTQKVKLLYIPKTSDKLSAFTGEITTFFDIAGVGETQDDDYDMGGAMGTRDTVAAEKNSASSPQLSSAEISAVEKEKNLLSADEAAAKILGDKYNNFTGSDYALSSSHLNSDYYDSGKYYWSLQFTDNNGNFYGNAQVNAETGEIISFYGYDYGAYSSEITFDEKASDALVKSAIEAYAPNKYSEYKLTNNSVLSTYDYATGIPVLKNSGKYYYYQRYVNGIVVENDYINVSVGQNGKITSYSINYSDVKFPSAKSMISESDAFEKLFAQQELTLAYYTRYIKNKTATALLYEAASFRIDAFSGKLVDYAGNEIINNKSSVYSDISNHSIKNIAYKLAENGITIYGVNDKLNPDSKITEEEFIRLIGNISKGNDFYPLYERTLYSSAASAKLEKTITRKDAVKCMITALGGNEFAELKGVYASPFSDVDDTDLYCGYFALANGFNIFGTSTEENINPDETLTRADALIMVYNYLINK